MKVTKKIIGELEKCYSLAKLQYNGAEHFLVAAEKVNKCMLFDLDGTYEETVWEQPGGVMTMLQVPGSNGQFLATHKFYSPNDSKEASIIIATPKGKDDWEIRKLVDLPFVHRFDILESNGKHYLIACALKSGHEFKGDWSMPGKVYAALLPEDLSAFDEEHQLELTVIKEDMLKNHGYYRHADAQGQSSIVSCDSGVFRFYPPVEENGKWRIEQLIETPASDALLLDFDQDGEDELAVLSPFHGNELIIYKKKEGRFEKKYIYPENLDFLHAIFGGMICGKPTLIIGHREGERYLLAITCDADGNYSVQEIDRGCGAANVLHIQNKGKDIIVAANREINEIAMYTLEPSEE